MSRIMEKFHWDYHTYRNQPPHFIENILTMAEIEQDYLAKQNNGK